MNLFVCLVNPTGECVAETVRNRYARQRCWRGSEPHWHLGQAWAALTDTDLHLGGGPEVATWDTWVGIGLVRLDNRAEIARRVGCRDANVSNIHLVTRLIAEHGEGEVQRLLGDFSWVIWNHAARTLIAACDAFAIRKLYHAQESGLYAFASRAELLALGEAYDVQYLAEVLAYAGPIGDRTAYRGVTAVPPASIIRIAEQHQTASRYWSAHECAASGPAARSEHEQIEECRELMMQAVASRLTGARDAWSYLSGGLDSSSIVSVAQWMVETSRLPEGLAGTITWVDRHGTGADEREYSDTVVERYGVRNEQQINFVPWQDDGMGPPLTDLPVAIDGFHARYRHEARLIRESGGRVLLTGIGGDNLFTGNMVFFADWLATGRIVAAAREMARRAAQGRVSFWKLAYKNAIIPLLPLSIQRRLVEDVALPTWIPRSMVTKCGLQAGAGLIEEYGGQLGGKYANATASTVTGLASLIHAGVTEDFLDVRHPYTYRPLVEFALHLKPEMCTRPQARKWVLREAMCNILPETIRSRVGKGIAAGVMSWSLVEDRQHWRDLLHDPILAQIGCIEPLQFRAAYDAVVAAPSSSLMAYGEVQHTLCIESWLQARYGRWTTENGLTRNEIAVH